MPLALVLLLHCILTPTGHTPPPASAKQFATPWTPTQPAWSALREYAYGHGQLHIKNATHALWQWIRDDDPWNPNPKTSIGDEAYFVRQQTGIPRC